MNRPVIAVLDYGIGNLRSAEKALEKVGGDAHLTRDPKFVSSADAVVLPGVGAFGACMDALRGAGLEEVVYDAVDSGKPFLGICVGMQMLFDESEEFGRHQGLGLIPGKVVRFPAGMEEAGERLKVPHMGWNTIQIKQDAPIFKGTAEGSYVYFVHSYYCSADNQDDVAASCRYGEIEFCAAIWRDNLMATQFHPEKSQDIGLNIFKNFGEL